GKLLVGPAQSIAQHADNVGPSGGVTLQEAENVAPVEYRKAASRHRGRIGRAVLAVEQRDFTEHFAGLQYRQHDPASLGRIDADAHAPSQNGHHGAAGRSPRENGFSGSKASNADARQQQFSLVGPEPAKKPALAQKPTGVLHQIASRFV